MSYDNLSSVSQNVLKFYQQLTGEERRVPFIFGKITHFTVVEMFSTLPHTPYMQIITPCMQVTPFPILTIYAMPFLIHNSSFTIYFFLQSL
jgi:hypothetical protein